MLWSIAWRNLARHRRRTVLTALAMAAVIALSMFMSGLMGGFNQNIRQAIIERQIGHIQVHHADYLELQSPYDVVAGASEVVEALRADDRVAHAASRVRGFAMFANAAGDGSTGPMLGVELDAEAALTGLDGRVTAGVWPTDGSGVVVGRLLARELELEPGDELVVVAPSLDGSMGNALFPVAGVISSGNVALDKGVVMALPRTQELLAMGDDVHEVVIVAGHERDITAIVDSAKQQWAELAVEPWWVVSPETHEGLEMFTMWTDVFNIVVLLVAAFGVINTLLMSVYERTRELGVMRALGMKPGQIRRLVLIEAFLLAVVSAVLGLAVGGSMDAYLMFEGLPIGLSEDEGFTMGAVTLDPVVYAVVTVRDIAVPLATLLIVSVVGGLWPAWRASRLDPVAAMRQD